MGRQAGSVKAMQVLPVRVRVVTEGGHTVRYVEPDPDAPPLQAQWFEPPPRPRLRTNPVAD